MAKKRYRKRPVGAAAAGGTQMPAAGGAPGGAGAQGAAGSGQLGDFLNRLNSQGVAGGAASGGNDADGVQKQEEAMPPRNANDNPRLMEVLKQHPGMSDAHGRLILDAHDRRDRAQTTYDTKKANAFRSYLNLYTDEETEEEKKARDRREKNARRWATIGDAVAALANIGGAMGGATPMQINKPLSQAQAERMEYARKLRESERQKRYNQKLKAYEQDRKEMEDAEKALDNADKNIQEQKYRAMTLQNTEKNQEAAEERAKAAQRLAEEKAEWQKEYQGKMAGVAQQNANTNAARAAETANYHGQMVGIAQQKANNSGHGSKKDDWEDQALKYSYDHEADFNKWENTNVGRGLINRYKYPNEKSRRVQFARSQMNQPKVTPKEPAGGGKGKVRTTGKSALR